jgi:PHD/YefM family antitoxin component YafN of YafNO toxin-antitoxin module
MPTLTIKSDKPVVVVPLEEYQDLLDTLEILSDSTLKRDVEKARKEFREGKTISLEKLRAELDAD